MRLQSPQNGSLTGEMKPISPLPSAKRVAAGGAVALAAERHELVLGLDDRPHLGVGQDLVLVPRLVGVERHELDEADLVGLLARERGEAQDLVLGEAAQRDRVDLDRAQLGVRLGGLEAGEHARRARRGA